MNVIGLESRTVGLHQKSTNLIAFVFHLRPDHRHIGYGAGRDPHFFAVQYVFFSNFASARPHAARIRSEIWFGQSEAAELFAFLHCGQPGVFLLVSAEGIYRIHHQRRLHADKRTHSGISAFQFLRDQAVFDVRHAGASVAAERGPEESEVSHRLYQFARKPARAVAFLNDRDEIVFDELARRVAHQALVVAQQRVEVDEVHTTEFDRRHYVSPHKLSRQRTGNLSLPPPPTTRISPGALSKHTGPSPQTFRPFAPSPPRLRRSRLPAARSPESSTGSPAPR